ncbi:MAG: DUF1097 domain-containing protein [Methylobacteriaceae bacterium]|jgi:hypothetical protein|nr:DUF1097 domain-containing protein [Methylobacteriaceae bacterium]
MDKKGFTLAYFGGPLIIAILAASMQAIDQFLASNTIIKDLLPGGGAWIAFQAWACYFLGGCNIKGGIRAFVAYLCGIVISIGIFNGAGVLGGAGFGFWAVPAILLPTVVIAITLERFDITSYVPALFVGAGAYFGIMGYIASQPGPYQGSFVAFGLVELFYCLFGLVWGYLTIVIRGAYDAKYNS